MTYTHWHSSMFIESTFSLSFVFFSHISNYYYSNYHRQLEVLSHIHIAQGKSQAIHHPLCVQWSVSSIVVPTTLSIDNKNWKYVCVCSV
jgi:hypothetical protein